jgi:hypothetical protein
VRGSVVSHKIIAERTFIPGSKTWTSRKKAEKRLEVQQIEFPTPLLGASRVDHLHNVTIGSNWEKPVL